MSNFAAKFVSRFAGVATLALAAVPVVALSTNAHAAPAPVHVQVADLDIGTAAGQATLERRIGSAARQMCRTERGLQAKGVCEAGVRAEAQDKLAYYIQVAAR